MKSLLSCLPIGLLSLFLLSCGSPDADDAPEDQPVPRALVDTAAAVILDISREERFPASVFYPEINKIAAPIAGYIVRSPAEAGEQVARGRLLFSLETREHRAINADPDLKDSDLAQLGVTAVHAPASGFLLTLDQRQGDYVAEGSTLCTIARSDRTGFKMNVPFEFTNLVRAGMACTVELPDKTRYPGKVEGPLNAAVMTSQAQTYLVKPTVPVHLPEGLNVTVLLPAGQVKNACLLPKSAVLANETMDEFWVMKLINDSIAVKVPVTLGVETREGIQITSPVFSDKDRLLTTGNYGLPDTALVKVKTREQ